MTFDSRVPAYEAVGEVTVEKKQLLVSAPKIGHFTAHSPLLQGSGTGNALTHSIFEHTRGAQKKSQK